LKPSEISFSSVSLIELIKSAFAKNSSFRFKVTGYSMSPFIKDSDIVTISPLPLSPAALGRVVAFIHPGNKKLIIHRIIGQNSGCFILKGDRIAEIDGLVPKENILGCVIRVERNNKDARLGIGVERRLIAFLSKNGFLSFIFYCGRLILFRRE